MLYLLLLYVQYVSPVLLIIKGIWHLIIASLLFADMTHCLHSKLTFTHFHPFTVRLLTSLPNVTLPQTRSSIIRPELIVMHFTAEFGKPYPWISTMYPAAYHHTSVASPLLLHPWPHCVTVPAVSREVRRSLLLHPTSNPSAQHTQTTDSCRPAGERVASRQLHTLTCLPAHRHTHTNMHTHTHTLFTSRWAETESTGHTILVVYIAVNSPTETVWKVVCNH